MSTLEIIGLVADGIGILGAIFALFAWMQSRALKEHLDAEAARQNEPIQVALAHGDRQFSLPVELRRSEFTRAEVLGRIGMIPLKSKDPKDRFILRHTNTPSFLKQINQIIDGRGPGVLLIPCDKTELNQFDMEAVKGGTSA